MLTKCLRGGCTGLAAAWPSASSRRGIYHVQLLEQRMLLSSTSGQIFVTDDYRIGEYTASGAAVNASLVVGLNTPDDLAGSGSDLFVVNEGSTSSTGTIGEYTTSGATVNTSLVSGLVYPAGIAVSGSDLFVTNYGSGTIGEYTTSGAIVNASLVSLAMNDPEGIAVSGSNLFVVNYISGTVGEYTTSGATVNASLITGLNFPMDVAIDGSDLFVTSYNLNTNIGTIGEYTTSGATVNASLVSDSAALAGITVSGSDLFVANGDGVGEYTLTGSTVNASLVSGLSGLGLSGTIGLYVEPTVAPATQLAFAQQPTSAVPASTLAPIVVDVEDSNGNLLTTDNSNVTLSITDNTTGATLSGTTTVAAVDGQATFSDLSIASVGSYTLTATDGADTAATSTSFNIAAPSLSFSAEPVDTIPSAVLAPITVEVDDSNGNLITTDDSDITLAIASGASGATLGGTTTVAAVNGVATFSDLFINTAGNNYALTATDGSDTPATSTSFNIFPPPEKIGLLDPTYGNEGLATHAVGFTSTNGVALQGDPKSIIIGTVGTSPDEMFGLSRNNADGSLDTAFGNSGVVTTSFTTSFGATDDVPAAVVVLPSGEILAAGTATTFDSGVPNGSEFALAEYTANGVLDSSFGVGGEVVFSFSSTTALSNDVVNDMAVSPAGIIYLAGSSDAGGTGTDFAIAAFNANGTIDTGFGSAGHVLVDFAGGNDVINAIALQSDGEIVAAGSTTAGGITSVALAGFLPNGSLDPRFGTKGKTITTVGNQDDEATSVAIQSDGRIVIGGLSASGSAADGTLTSSFLVARYTSTGKIDRSFGGGPVVTPFGQPAAVAGVVIQSNGDIIASGNTTASLATLVPDELELALASYSTKGTLNLFFNRTGTSIISLSGTQAGASAVHTDALTILPSDTTSDLPATLKELEAKAQGVINLSGGEITVVANSGDNTVEAVIVISGEDLMALFTSSFPSTVVGGANGSMSVQVGENGSDLVFGSITIQLSTSLNSDGSGDTSFQSLSEKITLKPQKNKIYRLKFDYPADLPNGDYFLLATVTNGAVPDLNPSDGIAVSSSAVDIAARFIDISGSNLTLSPFKTGKSAQVSFNIINNGNVPANGVISVQYSASVDKILSDATTLMTVPGLSLNLKNGSTKPAHQKLTIPTSLPAGKYYLLALLDPTNTLGDTDMSNNLLISSGTFSIP